MASAIDATKPVAGGPTTQSVRNNFATAASEITALQTAMVAYATVASPTFTGDPRAPTPTAGDNDTSIATTAFVGSAITVAPNKTITLSGDITGSGIAAITATLATVPVAKGGTGDTGTAWTTYTPTVTTTTGTLTTATALGRYKVIGKTVFIAVQVNITTNGTGAALLTATLPAGITAGAANYILSGRELTLNGLALTGTVAAGATSINIMKYDNTYPGTNGATLALSGVFETA